MPTIRQLADDEVSEAARELVERVKTREKRVFGIDTLSNIWRSMTHHPEYMEASWERSRATMQRGDAPPLVKEMVASAVSIVNACGY